MFHFPKLAASPSLQVTFFAVDIALEDDGTRLKGLIKDKKSPFPGNVEADFIEEATLTDEDFPIQGRHELVSWHDLVGVPFGAEWAWNTSTGKIHYPLSKFVCCNGPKMVSILKVFVLLSAIQGIRR